MIAQDRAKALAHSVRVGINLLKANVDKDELELLKEYIAADETISFDEKAKESKTFAAIEFLMEV